MASAHHHERQNLLQLPMIDFRGLDPTQPATPQWRARGTQVAAALESHGCFEAIYDRVGPELRDELFGRAIPELFALPAETKMKNADSFGPFTGYIGQVPDMAYESLGLDAAPTLHGVQEFTNVLWPQGNPLFSNILWAYSQQMQQLAEMVQRMFLHTLGLEEKYNHHHIEPKASRLRLSEYGTSEDPKIKLGLPAHLDPNMFTIICQHHAEGLEVESEDGEWIHVVPLANSFTVVIGEAFRAWTNGRFEPARHRVKMAEDTGKRFSVLFSTWPSAGCMQPMEELADADHPLLFRPFDLREYAKFKYTEEAKTHEDPLKAFCGVEHQGAVA